LYFAPPKTKGEVEKNGGNRSRPDEFGLKPTVRKDYKPFIGFTKIE
jgi:hypothetical protein